MSAGERTKQLITDTFTAMLKEMPLESIRIKDLCSRCGIDRHTFYYHFKDKYDLVVWIHMEMLSSVGQHIGKQFSRDVAVRVVDEMSTNSWFYERCFEYSGQNSLLSVILETSAESYEILLQQHLGLTLTPQMQIEIRYHVYGLTMTIAHWLKNNMSIPSEELVRIIMSNTPVWLREAIIENS
ncbi:MAG: TetR/AcrR family transcriptional regulator C-terminal domain-containing protein [Solobacterium sp.]|nr:TetR/AcrR family transcriptional regulator C-terminal domain-containing protein [Solobacterium sp.]MBR3127626.1 TetR/AcrR family transcriptional regulator C-terminal domain-containing protein [Solobacterium sp.]